MKNLILKPQAYQIIGCCMEVHNNSGHGFSEIVYKDALEYELRTNNIPFSREQEFVVNYKGIVLPHKFYADFVLFDAIILEVKVVSEFSKNHFNQVINYLAVSEMQLGLLVNFKNDHLEYKRFVL